MKSFKKLLVLAIASMLLIGTLTACGASTEEADTQKITLGTSAYSITVDKAYKAGEVTAEDKEEDQVAYYTTGEDGKVDFDVYQWKNDEGKTFEDEAKEDCKTYKGKKLEEKTVNGIKAFYYEAEEEYDGQTYTTGSYLFQDGEDGVVEITFWLDGDKAQEDVDAMLATLEQAK